MGILLIRKRDIFGRHWAVSAHLYQGQVKKVVPLQFTKGGVIVVGF